VAFRFAPDATNARSSQVYILTISEISNDRFWPKAAMESRNFQLFERPLHPQ
jgi:hypothetical protein